MAFGMKRWIAFTLAGCAFVAAWRLPPEPPEQVDRPVRTAEEIRYGALEGEARRTREVLFRMMWADSLSARTVAEAGDDGVVVMVPGTGAAMEEQKKRLARRVRDQVDGRTPEGRAMVFGYAVQPHDHRKEDGARQPRDRTETYVGTREGVDYCLQVRVTHAIQVERVVARRIVGGDGNSPPVSDELGPCRFYLSYGFAGEEIQRWLEDGAVEFALEADQRPELEIRRPPRRRGPFGFGYISRDPDMASLDRCLAGVEMDCASFFEEAGPGHLLTDQQRDIVRRSPATGIGSRFSALTTLVDQRYILADLEAEFGRNAFRQFWTSDESVGEAFEAAFGVSTGAWMLARIDRLVGIDQPGPGVSREASSASMLTIGLLLGIAWWRRRDRDVAA